MYIPDLPHTHNNMFGCSGEAGYTTPEQVEPPTPLPSEQPPDQPRRPEQRRTRLESEDIEHSLDPRDLNTREVIKKHLNFDAGTNTYITSYIHIYVMYVMSIDLLMTD